MADARPGRTAAAGRWTEPADVLDVLRRRWRAGTWLTAMATSQPWEPVAVPLRGPTATDLADRYDDVLRWVSGWRRAQKGGLRLDFHSVGGRRVGVNELPRRVWLDRREQVFTVLGVQGEAATYLQLVRAERERAPRLVDWMLANPHQVLDAAAEWDRLVSIVLWTDAHGSGPDAVDGSRPYLRQIDLPGVDTKFIEERRGILARLLDAQLEPARIDQSAQRSDLVRRYRFRAKPQYLRFRFLDGVPTGFGGFSELTVRLDEMQSRPLPVSRIYVVENEITYLAFPAVPDAAVVFGGGYAVGRLTALRWLGDRELHYWGDLDTHGFAILNVMRRRFPQTRSLLMDRKTLLDHESQWVREPDPTSERLELLNSAESDLYQDLVENSFGPAVRLEQERIRFSAITNELRSAGSGVRSAPTAIHSRALLLSPEA
ncbi:Wadjet anti-phage system protein JetD domain-containing protein [Nakamurella sp. GG22]